MKRTFAFIAAMALLAAACAGTADATDGVASIDDAAPSGLAAGQNTPQLTQEEALLAFTACLREQGLDVTDPTIDDNGNFRLSRPDNAGQGGDFDREVFQAARQECSEFLDGVTLGFQDQDRTELEDTLVEFASCMRDNGYDMPDPDFSAFGQGAGGGGGPFGQIDRDDAAFQSAQDACSDILAGFGPGGGGGFGGRGNRDGQP